MRKKRICLLCCFLAPILYLAFSLYIKIDKIPNTIFIREGQNITYDYLLKFSEDDDVKVSNLIDKKETEKKAKVKLLGLLPIKSVSVKAVPSEVMLYPGGQPLGVKISTKGVLVVALSDIETAKGKVTSPGASSGIQIGDSIIKINKKEISSAEQVASLVNSSEGNELAITIERKGTIINKKVTPIKNDSDNSYKIGLWVRDSTAGVGTLTFYDAKSQRFAALGHPITDIDTGTILNVSTGQIVSSSIVSVRKGLRGSPGELKGIFVDEDSSLGSVSKNTECGIFGSADKSLINKKYDKPMKVALRNEIKEGPAKIITTVQGEEPKAYSIEIQKLLEQDSPGPKSMIIKVTDSELLEKTGGIVQGMSGSPIIQNDKIVGAVTHVLINKPDVGYGIYIEWMLKDADILTK
ncbi:SpoIVB peptidase [Clostridium omnivorum]|uniref:SpoIVB peptidase n=1 Tax=Clostridium omnivorum TaxID=1604902 RepID=A0ABQ5NB00_9CLOT|nr:SpoIVB peptidase [Clostridium sp. E14]GLC32442.1 SpoIVB peptidase [Clostridium sp. E14]